jgi:hypothetical protein
VRRFIFISRARPFFFCPPLLYLKIVRRLISFRVRTYLFCGRYTFSRPRPHSFVVGAHTSQLLFISLMHPLPSPFTYLTFFFAHVCHLLVPNVVMREVNSYNSISSTVFAYCDSFFISLGRLLLSSDTVSRSGASARTPRLSSAPCCVVHE